MKKNGESYMKALLEKLPGAVSVGDIRINEDSITEYVSLENEALGTLAIQRLKETDAADLYDFYFNGLSEESRRFWPPYPLFSPPVYSAEELAGRIKEWQKEDDWTVLKVSRETEIIGVGLLKRWKTERPVSGLAISEDCRGKGIGFLLQTVINEQASLLGLDRIYATLAPNNTASLKVHLRCGFRQTGRMVPHFIYHEGVKEIDRQDIEMVRDFSHDLPLQE